MALDDDIESVLWSEEKIAKRVADLAAEISADFQSSTGAAPVFIGVATGALLFLSDLVRRVKLPISIDFIRAASYGSGTVSNGAPKILSELKVDVSGKHVVLVEDIVDTGLTLSHLVAHLESKGASSVSVCAFLDKPVRRKVNVKLVGEGKFYIGFQCPDYFVVGYGMDFAELYRNLPYVGVLKLERYKMDTSIRGRGRNKRFWTVVEDETLIHSLLEISHNPKWKGENGFKSGCMNKLEEMISAKLPNCGLRAEPHIESRLKHWSEKYCALAKMLSQSGFAWDNEKKLLKVERSVFDEWVKSHKKAKELFGIPFPYYDLLAEIYGKDRATGEPSESFVLAIENMNAEMTHESVTLDSDDDDDLEAQTEIDSLQSSTGASGSRKRKNFPSQRKYGLKKKKDEISELPSTLQSVSMELGKIFENMNSHLGAMTQIWGGEEERKKKLDDESNRILEEVMKLDILSPSDALEVATMLMAEEHKIRVFYQATTSMKKQYVCNLLKKK